MNELLPPSFAILAALYGAATSYIQERFGRFQELTASQKQVVNAVVNLLVPVLAVLMQPYWKPDFGSLEGAVRDLLFLMSPLAVWLFSQIAHQFDRLLQGKPR